MTLTYLVEQKDFISYLLMHKEIKCPYQKKTRLWAKEEEDKEPIGYCNISMWKWVKIINYMIIDKHQEFWFQIWLTELENNKKHCRKQAKNNV